jgi:hypothetical protein
MLLRNGLEASLFLDGAVQRVTSHELRDWRRLAH